MNQIHEEHAAAMNTIATLMEILGVSDSLSISGQVAQLKGQCEALAAENAGLKSKLMFWDAEDPESPYDTPEEVAQACSLNYGDEFVVQAAAKLPNRTYRVLEDWDCDCKVALVDGAEVETPATDRFLAEVKAQGADMAGEHLKKYAQGLHDDARLVLQDGGELCHGFAQQLREAKCSK